MKVATVFLGRGGGGESYSLELSGRLARECEVHAFVSSQAANVVKWRDGRFHVTEVDTYTGVWEFIRSTLMSRRIPRLADRIRDFGPNVIYYPMVHLWTPLLNRLLGEYPKVLTVHDPDLWRGRHNLPLLLAQKWAIKQSVRFILLANSLRPELYRHGVTPGEVDVIPHGEFSCYRTAVDDGPSESRSESEGPGLLFFGRIEPYKGLDVLLKAVPRIQEKMPNARLMIVGRGSLKRYRGRLDRLSNVEVVNEWIEREQITSWFRQASVLVSPYTYASQSGVIPVAYAHSVPVVATRVGGLPDQVDHGVTGFLVPPRDPEALAQACTDLLLDPDRAVAMGRAGRRKAETEWNWERIAKEVVETLKTAVAAH